MAFLRRKAAAPIPAGPSSSNTARRMPTQDTKRKNRMSLLFNKSFSLGRSPSSEAITTAPTMPRDSPVRPSEADHERTPTPVAAPSPPRYTAVDDVALVSSDTDALSPDNRTMSRHSRLESFRPLPPVPPTETSLAGIGLGLLDAAFPPDIDDDALSVARQSTGPVESRRTSMPASFSAATLRSRTSSAASTQDRRRTVYAIRETSPDAPSLRKLSGVQVHVSSSRHVERRRLSASGPPSAATRLRQDSGGPRGREHIARLRAEWSSMSSATDEAGESTGTSPRPHRYGARSISMYELKAPKPAADRRASSSSTGSRRDSTGASLKPLRLETSASHASLKQLLNKPMPPPPRPPRSSARYCLRPTRDFSTQTPAEWNSPQSSQKPTSGRPRNHRRGSSWDLPAHFAPGSLSPLEELVSTFPSASRQGSPVQSRYGAPSPSVYSVASFDTGRGWTRAGQAVRGSIGQGMFEDLHEADEATTGDEATFEAATAQGLGYDSPFEEFSLQISPVREGYHRLSNEMEAASISPFHGPPRTVALPAGSPVAAVADKPVFADKIIPRLDTTETTLAPVLVTRDSVSSTSEHSVTSPGESEHVCERESPPTSLASSVCSDSAELDEKAPFQLSVAKVVDVVPTSAAVGMMAVSATSQWVRAVHHAAVSPVPQLPARRFSETDTPIPRAPRRDAVGAVARAAKGRSFFLVQALMGEPPAEGLVRDWAQDANSDDDSDSVSLLSQATSVESDQDDASAVPS